MTDVIEESRADQHKMLAAMVTAVSNHGSVKTSALARRARINETRAANALYRLSNKDLVQHHTREGRFYITAKGWKEAGVKPPLWVRYD